MLRTVRFLAIPATLLMTTAATAGPYDAYKPPSVPPAADTDEVVRVAQTEVGKMDVTNTDNIQPIANDGTIGGTVDNGIVVDGGMQPMAQGSYIPPAPQSGEVVIMDQSATTVVTPQQHYHTQPTQSYSSPYRTQSTERQRPMQRLMELERRKNAWLRKTFLNR